MVVCPCKKRDKRHPAFYPSYHLHWSWGNSKLWKDRTLSFNTPAFRSDDGFITCPSASTCALVCFARQAHYTRTIVKRPREHNLTFLRSHSMHEFIATAVEDIGHFHPSWAHVRIHDSGDFFSTQYFMAWIEIARQSKTLLFYAYSKEIAMLHEYRYMFPENFRVIQSYGGKQDDLIDRKYAHSIIFPTHKERKAAGYIDASHSDKPAFQGKVKIGLVYHGSIPLSPVKKQLLIGRIPSELKRPLSLVA